MIERRIKFVSISLNFVVSIYLISEVQRDIDILFWNAVNF